jgi:uncharacterized protein (TIGR02145 family)
LGTGITNYFTYLFVKIIPHWEYILKPHFPSRQAYTQKPVYGANNLLFVLAFLLVLLPTWVSAQISGRCTGGVFIDDRDGKSYQCVTIGDQVWMAENLNYEADDSYCYKNEMQNCFVYGRLYTWAAAMVGAPSSSTTPSGVQGVCPLGWYVPSDADWEILANYIANQSGYSGFMSEDWTQIGLLLKSKSGWEKSFWIFNGNGKNAFQFSALPGGYRFSSGRYQGKGYYTAWWSSTEFFITNAAEFSINNAYVRSLHYDKRFLYRKDHSKKEANSIRCLQKK